MADDGLDVKAEGQKLIGAQQKKMRQTAREADQVMARNRQVRDYDNALYERADRMNKGLQGPKTWGPEAARRGQFPDAHGKFPDTMRKGPRKKRRAHGGR